MTANRLHLHQLYSIPHIRKFYLYLFIVKYLYILKNITTASWSPTPGATVRITKTSSAEVTGSSTALEIYSDPLREI